MIAVFTRRLQQRFRARALEWEHAGIAVLWGMILLGSPDLFGGRVFAAPIFQLPGPIVWGWAMLILGLARLAALAVNGYLARPTALIRSLSAIASVALFALICIGIVASGTPVTGLAAYLPMVGFDALAIYWAVIDVRVLDRHDHPD